MGVVDDDQVLAAQVVGRQDPGQKVEIQRMVVGVKNGDIADISLVVHVRQGSEYVDIQALVLEIISRLKQHIKGWISRGQFTGNSLFQVISTLIDEYGPKSVDISVIGSVILDFEALFVVVGQGYVSVSRENKYGVIINHQGVVEGKVAPGDTIVLSTQSFFKILDFHKVAAIVSQTGQTPDQLAEQVVATARFGKSLAVLILNLANKPVAKTKRVFNPLNVFNQVKQIIKFPKRHRDEVFVKPAKRFDTKQQLGGVIFFLLVILLGLSVAGGWWRRQQFQAQQDYQNIAKPVEKLLQDAQLQKAINPRVARAWLRQARNLLESHMNDFKQNSKESGALLALKQTLDREYLLVAGEIPVQLTTYIDLQLIKDGFYGQRMYLFEQTLWILDAQLPLLLKVGASNKNADIFAGGGDVAGARLVAGNKQTALVMGSQGVMSIQADTARLAVETDPDWVNVAHMGMYGENVYIMDTSLGEIWRYNLNRGVNSRQRWLAPTLKPDFSSVTDITIDGDIWVLSKLGEVRQYQKGVSVGVTLDELDSPWQEPISIALDGEVLILDRQAKRVVEFDRSGAYLKQYQWEQVVPITDMVAVDKKVLLLAGSKVYSFTR